MSFITAFCTQNNNSGTQNNNSGTQNRSSGTQNRSSGARNQNSVTQIALFCMTDTASVLRSNNTERIYVTFNMQADDFWFFSTRNRRSIVWPEYRQYPSLAVWQSIQYGIKGKSMYVLAGTSNHSWSVGILPARYLGTQGVF